MAALNQLLQNQYQVQKKQALNRPDTPEYQAVEKMENEIAELEKECAQYNNPEHFAKFGKMQRQILKL